LFDAGGLMLDENSDYTFLTVVNVQWRYSVNWNKKSSREPSAKRLVNKLQDVIAPDGDSGAGCGKVPVTLLRSFPKL
jgi:hypothetical protein